jgi:predicted nucleic acid-binding protein
MGYLIDTHILSELQKEQRCHPNVQNWYSSVNAEQLFLSVLVIGEIRQGIERLRHRDAVQANVIEQRLVTVKRVMQGRILPITQAVAERFGYLNSPNPLPVIDGLLAATALEHDLILVTRNTKDVERSGVKLLNPFLF